MNTSTPKILDIPSFRDARGELNVVEASKQCGFDVRRVYYFYGSQPDIIRGNHAHKKLKQFMICLNGSVDIKITDASGDHHFKLDHPSKGLLLQGSCWRELQNVQFDTVVAVLASEEYDESDYIRDYGDFQKWIATKQTVTSVPYLALDRMHAALEFPINRALSDVIRSNQLIGGDAVKKFEGEFAAYCDAKHAIGCGNGLDALAMILEAFEIGAGDEILVPSNSFFASALAVDMVGAKAVLVDCDPLTHSIDLTNLASYITPNTKAIMPVHLYGTPADMNAILAFAKQHNLYVIEDAAQAHGATIHGKKIGGLGHAAAFSFYPTKNLGALGDGGAVVTNDAALADKIRMLGSYGSKIKYHHDVKGRNSRLDPLQAAVLSIKLTHLNEWNARRQYLADIYYRELANVSGIILPAVPAGFQSVWHVFPIRVTDGRRDELKNYLEANSVGTNIHYPIPIHKQKAYGDLYEGVNLPNSELVSIELLSLPLDPFHSDEEIRFVIKNIKSFFAS